ncbi:predicted protein [Streptomyces sp. SPB78]|nr:predicted protein [Streptomyces sp. SPB78]
MKGARPARPTPPSPSGGVLRPRTSWRPQRTGPHHDAAGAPPRARRRATAQAQSWPCRVAIASSVVGAV